LSTSAAAPPTFLRTWLVWTAGFLAFPVAGLAGTAVAGRVDSPVAALLGGLVAGLVLGAGQSLVSRRRLDPRRWVPATGVGMSTGLLLGAVTVGYGTSLADLAVMGAITGIALGVTQAVALPRRTRTRWAWAALMPALWSLGWVVSTLVLATRVDAQFTIFGASGAVTVAALSGLLLHRLLVYRPAASPRGPTPAGVGV
jgi:hypothetical protein